MSTEDIRRQLAALDAEFDSPENKKSGKLTLAKWSARRAAIVQRHTERAERMEPAVRAAPSLTRAELDAILWPPKISDLSRVDSAELAAFNRNFDEAINSGDIEAARTIAKNPRREALSQSAQLARVGQALRDGYQESGAKSLTTMLVGAIGALFHESTEAHINARLHRASRVDQFDDFSVALEGRTFTFAMRCGDRLVKREIKAPIPLYRGTWSDGTKAEHSDVFTMGGSLWIAKRDTMTKPPGADWQLAVQKGRDAR